MRTLPLPKPSAAAIALALTFLLFLLAAVGGPSPLPGPATASAASCPGADSAPRQISSKTASRLVVCLVNKQRAKRGLNRLKARGALVGAASRHSEHMQRTDCFDHVCPGEPSLPGSVPEDGLPPMRLQLGRRREHRVGSARRRLAALDRRRLDGQLGAPEQHPQPLLPRHRRRRPLGLTGQERRSGRHLHAGLRLPPLSHVARGGSGRTYNRGHAAGEVFLVAH